MPLRQLYPDQNAESTASNTARVDIIAVHGLNPRSKNDRDHALDTWRTPSGPQGRLWLRDDLPRHVPESRIFLYEYSATAVYGGDRDTFVGKANELLEAIRIERDEVELRPILLLGHSMGGLLIKQALINAHNNPKYTPIKDATTGLAFFATPHHGGDWMLVSLGGVVAKIATVVGFQKGDDVLETLKNGSIFSEIMQEHWRHQLEKYNIISFWGALDKIVPAKSAQFGMSGDRENIVKLNADHSGVCKFGPSLDDQDNFRLVQSNIRDLYKEALRKMEASETLQMEEHTKIMQSLSRTNFWSKQVDLFRRAQKGSGQWILVDERFKSWLTGHPKICWCKGEAGAGKTFLSAIIIDYLSCSMKNKKIGIAWLYVDYRERDSHTLENFYANLLLQLFEQTGRLSKSMMKSLGSKREEAKPSAAEYKSWLQEEVQKFDRTIIIIDALDEMRTEELCKQLINELQSLIPRIYLLVTSRLEIQLPIISDDLIEIEIRPRKKDVILFIESRLKDSPLLLAHISENPSLRDLTMDMLAKANNRMFLKAELILNVLEHLKTAKEVEETLNSLPDTYDGCYEFTLKQIERKDASQRQLASKVLSWLSFVFDGLTVSAFQEALSVQTGDKKVDEEKLIPVEELVSVCSGLVVTYSDTENNTQKIRLLHETASTYLKNVGSPLGHEMILEACLAYLSLTEFSDQCIFRTRIDERGRQYPFYQYAATYWSRHVIQGKLETTFRDPIIKFLESYQRRSADEFLSSGLPSAWGCDNATPWTDWNKRSVDRRDRPLHAATVYGLSEIVRYFIKNKGYEKDGRNNFGETALHRAAQVGSTGTIEELITQGADLNSKVYHNYFKETTALVLAMNCQQIEAVQVLLNHGVELNTFDPKNITFPLHIAASINTRLTRILLDHGATVHFPGISPQFPEVWPGSLHFTVFNAHEFPGALERVNLLLDRGANINSQSSEGNTALHMAIIGGHQDLVHILLQKGANISLKNKKGKSAVQLARERGHLDWIEEGIPTELFRSLPRGPPLHRAIWSKNHSLVHELLEKGHDIEEEDQEIVTPWGYCILSGDVELAQILVDHMETRKSINHVGNTAFELALTHMTAFNYTDQWSWEKTVQICRKLLPFRRMFDPNLEFTKTESPICNYKKTFLIWAAELGRIDEAKFFLDCGSDVNARDVYGASGLGYAVGRRSYGMVELLIQRGANPKLGGNTGGQTPLMAAENAGNIVIKKLLQDTSSGQS